MSLGFRKAIAFVARRSFDTIIRSRDVLFKVDLVNYSQRDDLVNRWVEVQEKKCLNDLTHADLGDLRNYGGDDLIRIFEKRLEEGYRLFVGYMNGEIAGITWAGVGGKCPFQMIPLWEKDFIYLFTFTIDKFRHRGVSTTLYLDTMKKLKSEGFQRGFIYTKEWNFHQKAILKVGFELVGKFREFKLFNRSILVWSSLAGGKIIHE